MNSSTRVLAKSAANCGSAESEVISMMRVVPEALTLMPPAAAAIALLRSRACFGAMCNTLRQAASLSVEVPYPVFFSLRSRSVVCCRSDRLWNTFTWVRIS